MAARRMGHDLLARAIGSQPSRKKGGTRSKTVFGERTTKVVERLATVPREYVHEWCSNHADPQASLPDRRSLWAKTMPFAISAASFFVRDESRKQTEAWPSSKDK